MYFDLTDALMGLVGGLLIGTASAIFLLGNARIAGISGIAGGLIARIPQMRRMENLAFLAGLIGAPALYAAFVSRPEINITTSIPLLIVGGLLVGFGTRLGNGCTSGHGVCGMSRFSLRSIGATLTFMAVAVVTVLVTGMFFGGAS